MNCKEISGNTRRNTALNIGCADQPAEVHGLSIWNSFLLLYKGRALVFQIQAVGKPLPLAASIGDRATNYDITLMKFTLDNLSDNECQLYKDTISLKGTIEELTQQLSQNGIFDKYRILHQQYLELFNMTEDDKIKNEVLKRLTFLNWYSILEPSCFTGLDNLDNETIFNSFSILNDYIKAEKFDTEFVWMLSYYSCWDWIILTFSENKLKELTNFVKSVDTSVLYVPKHQLPKGSMDNRGQMGIYWTSCSVEKSEIK